MATISLTTPYTQNFDTLASSGTSSTVPDGWAFVEASANANGTYSAGTGSGNQGDTYSFGAGGSSDRAFGMLQSGTLVATIGAGFTNASGQTLSALTISYTGEMWRLGTAGRDDRIDFQYSLDATSLTTGTWIHVDALDFVSPDTSGTAGARDGNSASFSTLITATLGGLDLAAGASFWIRWTDFNASGADDGLAIDDFSLSFSGGGGGLPTVSVTAFDAAAAEAGSDPGTFRITRSGATSDALIVGYTLGGSASAADYTPTLSGSVTIPAGAAFVDLTITPVDDSEAEGPETLVLTLLGGAGYTVGGPPATITLADNDAALTLISAIQGSGLSSPLQGQLVTIEAIVVGDFQGTTGLSGFFVQEEDSDADGNALTSEGLFIFQGTPNSVAVQVGDKVRVTGTVAEFVTSSGTSSLTQLGALTGVEVLASGQPLPTAVELSFPLASAASLEAVEGMRVSVSTTMTVSDTFTLGRYGEVLLSSDGPGNQPGTDARLDQYTQFNSPDPAGYAAYLADIATRRLLVDDANAQQNRDPIVHGRDGLPLSATNTLRGGDTISTLVGIIDDRFGTATIGAYRLQPTEALLFEAGNPRPGTPDVDGRITVAAFNVLNYFNGPGFPTSRGADNPAEYQRQLDKLVAALAGMDADVVGLIEIENDGYGPTSAIQTLVDAVNAVMGAGTYAFVDPGSARLGGDEIAVGMIYKPATVTPLGAAAVLDSSVDPRFDSSVQRPSLAQTFEDLATGALFTPVINHLKSKSSSAGRPGDADAGDGQGLSNATRTLAAQALVDWLAGDPTGASDGDFIILGDLNAYAMEDPLVALRDGHFVDLLPASTYSYSFNGQWGSLDHALGSASLLHQVVDAGKWHINADEPTVLDYNLEFKSVGLQTSLYAADAYRSSDHDPVLVGLNPGLVVTGTARGELLLGSIGNDVIQGGQGRDLLVGGAGADLYRYSSVLDAYDAIIGFVPGSDRIDISALLASVGAAGADPVAGGHLRVFNAPTITLPFGGTAAYAHTLVLFDPDGDGPAPARPLVELIGVGVTDAADLLGSSWGA